MLNSPFRKRPCFIHKLRDLLNYSFVPVFQFPNVSKRLRNRYSILHVVAFLNWSAFVSFHVHCFNLHLLLTVLPWSLYIYCFVCILNVQPDDGQRLVAPKRRIK